MRNTVLSEKPLPQAELERAAGAAHRVALEENGDRLAFSALLREVLGDVRKDPAFFALDGRAEPERVSPLEPAA